jgi:ATP-dependent exoDNAse (exonuclease V) alpha subunit
VVNISLRLEDGPLQFNAAEHPHFDHGYGVTNHSSQGLTADRVLVNIEMTGHPQLINSRFAYVAVSRASLDASMRRFKLMTAQALGKHLLTTSPSAPL